MEITQARRIALAAQGIGRFDRDKPATMRQVQQVIDQIAQFQIDSVNILARAHLMPLFTRLGAYDSDLLIRASTGKSPRLFDYWSHAASLIDINLYPALRFRMDDYANNDWWRTQTILAEHPTMGDETLAEVRTRGPVTARDLDQSQRTSGGWWNWSAQKTVMECLFRTGHLAVARRNSQFERLFDLPERVIPPAVFEQPSLSTEEAHATLVRRAAQGLGIGSLKCLADYFRTDNVRTRAAIAALETTGELERVEVDGWKGPLWRWAGGSAPRAIHTAALVSPFDSLVFERRRLRDLFGTDYTISLYTPADKRKHGYYVYLFLLDEQFAARVDLKADRKTARLLVQSAWLEDGADPDRTARALATELNRSAEWLGLTAIEVADKGTLSATLRPLV